MNGKKLTVFAILLTLALLIASHTTIGQPVHAEHEVVNPPSGRGRYGETVAVSVCGLRPGGRVERIDFVNKYTGQIYTYTVDVTIDEQGCFSTDLVLGNMSYGLYDVVVYELPAPPPEPLVNTAVIKLNETGIVIVNVEELGVNAAVKAEFTTLAFWGYRYYNYTTGTAGAVLGLVFTAENGVNYTIIAWLSDSTVYFRLLDAEGKEILNATDERLVCDASVCWATWEFNMGEPVVQELYNNKAIFTYYPDTGEMKLDLYYGGRKLEITKASLKITYVNYDTDTTLDFYYEYPANLTFGDYGLESITTPPWVDADINWTAKFEWDARTGEAVLTVHAEYLPRKLVFEEKYEVEPIIYLNGEPVESGSTLKWWTVYEYSVELYGFTPNKEVKVLINGDTLYEGTIGIDGNTSFAFTVPLEQLVRGSWYTIRISGYYSSDVETYEYVVNVVIAYPAIFINGELVEPGKAINLGYACAESQITVEARGFPPSTPLHVYLDDQPVGEFETDENGAFTQVIAVGALPFECNSTNKLTILALYDEEEYDAHATFIIPGLFVDGNLVEFGGTHEAGIIVSTRVLVVEAFNFPQNTPIEVYLNDVLINTYYTDEYGYALIQLDAHRTILPGETGVYRVVAKYNGCVYEVAISFKIKEIHSYFNLINPITGEYLTEPRASAGYYNRTLIATLNGEPFEYLGDVLEVYIEGLGPGEKVIVKLVGPLDLVIYDGVAEEDGTLQFELTVPSLPRGNYAVVAYLPERGYSVVIPWSMNSGITYFEVYPKIIVTRLDGYEVPVIVGSATVRLFGSGFDRGTTGRFIVLLNGTDAIATVNYHAYSFWRTNSYGLLVGPGGSQTGLLIPVLEPGVYAITVYVEAGDYTAGTGYVFVVNNLANIATKEDIEEVVNILEIISADLTEVLSSLGTIENELSGVAFNIMTLLEQQDDVLNILEELRNVVATKDDITNIVNYLEQIGIKIDDLYLTMLALYDELNVRIDDLETYLATLILQIESELLERTYELEDLIVYLYTLLDERIDDLELALLSKLEEVVTTIMERIGEVEQVLTEKLSYLELQVENVYTMLSARIDDLEMHISSRLDDLELWLEELSTLVLNVHNSLNDRIEQLEGTIAEALADLEYRLNMRIDELELSLTEYVDLKVEHLALLIENVYTTLVAMLDEVENTLLDRIEELDTRVLARMDSLEQLLNEVNASLHASLYALEEFIEMRVSDVESMLDELTSLVLDVHDSLYSRIEQLEETLSTAIAELENMLIERIDELKSSLIEYMDVKTSYLASLIENINETLIVELNVVKELISTSTEHLETLITGVNTTLHNRIEELENTVLTRINMLESTLTDRINNLESQISDVNASLRIELAILKEFVNERIGEVESKISDLTAQLNLLEASLIQYIENKSRDILSLIDSVNSTLSAELNKLKSDINALRDFVNETRNQLTIAIDARYRELAVLINDLETRTAKNISAVLVELDSLKAYVNQTSRDLSSMITSLIEQTASELETNLALNISVVAAQLKLCIDQSISELNQSIRAMFETQEVRLEEVEKDIASINLTITDLGEDVSKRIGEVFKEVQSVYENTSRQIDELRSRVDMAIEMSGEAGETASTAVKLSAITMVLVIVSVAFAALTYIKLIKKK